MSANENKRKRRAGVHFQNVVRSDTVAFAEFARRWRDLCLRIDRHPAHSAAQSVASPGSPKARRFGGSNTGRKMDALPMGETWRSTRASCARRIARVDGKR